MIPNLVANKWMNEEYSGIESVKPSNMSSANSSFFKFPKHIGSKYKEKKKLGAGVQSIGDLYKSIEAKLPNRRKPTFEIFSKLESKHSTTNKFKGRKHKSSEVLRRNTNQNHSQFEPDLSGLNDLSGRHCVVLEKRSDHMIRMNYIRYVKTQFHEMRMQEEDEGSDSDENFTFKVYTPGQETLNSKVYDFYKSLVRMEGKEGLVSIEEYIKNYKNLDQLQKEEFMQEMRSQYNLNTYNSGIFKEKPQKEVKASIKNPVLNIKPKTQQTKRAMPRSVLRAVKKLKPEHDTYQSKFLSKRRMKAYREALSMLDAIKN